MLALGIGVLLDLDRQHLSRGHLAVEVLDDAAQLGTDSIGNEDEPESFRFEIRIDGLPETFDVFDPETLKQHVAAAAAALPGDLVKPIGHPLNAERRSRVRGVLEHLRDDFTAAAGIGTALDLHERGNSVLVEIQVV